MYCFLPASLVLFLSAKPRIDTTRTDIRCFFSRIKRNPADRSNPMKIERNRRPEYFCPIDFHRIFHRFFSANSLSPPILIVISLLAFTDANRSRLAPNFPLPSFFFLYIVFIASIRFTVLYIMLFTSLPCRCWKLSSRFRGWMEFDEFRNEKKENAKYSVRFFVIGAISNG